MRAILAGCGHSVRDGWEVPEGIDFVLGVNDVARYGISPEHLLVIDSPDRFPPDRRYEICRSQPQVFWYEDDAWLKERRAHTDHGVIHRKVKLITWQAWCQNPQAERLPGRHTSMIPGMVLAYQLGARRIGVIGADMIGHEELGDKIIDVNSSLRATANALDKHGCTVHNLSTLRGRLTGLPGMDLESWLELDNGVQHHSEPTAS